MGLARASDGKALAIATQMRNDARLLIIDKTPAGAWANPFMRSMSRMFSANAAKIGFGARPERRPVFAPWPPAFGGGQPRFGIDQIG